MGAGHDEGPSWTYDKNKGGEVRAARLVLPGGGELVVHRFLDCPGWFVSVHRLGMNDRELHGQQLCDAQLDAIGVVTTLMSDVVATLDRANAPLAARAQPGATP
jgi:hypothetical protein